jgi:hypothetical protein
MVQNKLTKRKNSGMVRNMEAAVLSRKKSFVRMLHDERQEQVEKAIKNLEKLSRPSFSRDDVRVAINFGRK